MGPALLGTAIALREVDGKLSRMSEEQGNHDFSFIVLGTEEVQTRAGCV
ncbi:MAG: hypothetical protein GY758_24340 [Fuerstiella sp.]|jgi:hypothetical protein|nr:hypothetical protein [Fuerstiella sp.]MCP4508607.1 hypothetical protein [Fuerstiella sp.]